MRGAIQRYIYGHFVDSILWSCFSTEFGLLIKLDEVLLKGEKDKVPKPFTLGKIISWASSIRGSNGKTILNKKTKKAAKEIQRLRNAYIHGANFIAALILSYQSIINLQEVNLEAVKNGLKILTDFLPSDTQEVILKKYKPSDIINSLKTIHSLSTFEWCANKKLLRSIQKESENMVMNVASSFLDHDYEKLKKYFQTDYLLKEHALRALRAAHLILSEIGIQKHW